MRSVASVCPVEAVGVETLELETSSVCWYIFEILRLSSYIKMLRSSGQVQSSQ